MARETERERMIVIRWLARRSVETLGPTFHQAYPVDEAPSFDDALDAIDEAERQVWDLHGTAGKPE